MNGKKEDDDDVVRISEPLSLERSDDGGSDDSKEELSSEALEEARRLLYISHLFAKGSEIAWQFCLVLFLAAFTKYQSLILVSTYGLFSAFTVFVCGGRIGEYVDQTPRLQTARFFIVWENTSVVVATIGCYILFQLDTNSTSTTDQEQQQYSSWWYELTKGVPTSWGAIVCLIGIHFFGAIARVLDKGFTVAVEKDWIVVMSQQATSVPTAPTAEKEPHDDDAACLEELSSKGEEQILLESNNHKSQKIGPSLSSMWLSQTNVTMTQIDLGCKAIAPTIAGFIMAAFDGNNTGAGVDKLSGVAFFLGILNCLALLVEWVASARIYKLVPALAIKANTNNDSNKDDDTKHTTSNVNDTSNNNNITSYSSIEEDVETNFTENPNMNPTTAKKRMSRPPLPLFIQKFIGHWQIYLKQSICGGGISFALLYLNVLSFHDLMTAYLVWRGLSLEIIGVCRGIANAIGLLGTVVYHYSVQKMSVQATGMWSITYQFTCLTLCYVSLFIPPDPAHAFFSIDTPLLMLVGGVCASRIGLWVFDISITQLMQEYIPQNERGVVGGVQESLHAFFEIISYVLGIIFPDPAQFFVLVITGYVSVGLAVLFYLFGIYLSGPQKNINKKKC